MAVPFWLLCMVWQLLHGPVTLARAGPQRAVITATAIIEADMVSKILFGMAKLVTSLTAIASAFPAACCRGFSIPVR